MSRRQRINPVKKKTIDLYVFTYNDADLLPFFLDYYKFVNTMTFLDSGSDDGSLEILRKFATPDHPEINLIETGATWWDLHYLFHMKNNIWRKSKADLVFFPDLDEIFYHPDLVKFLNESNNDIYEMTGYEMVSDGLPKNSLLEIKDGVYFQMYNKSTIFKPNIGMQFLNSHVRYCRTDNVSIGEIQLLHYRNLGIDMMLKRRDREKNRLPKGFKERTAMSDKEVIDRFNSLKQQAIKVI